MMTPMKVILCLAVITALQISCVESSRFSFWERLFRFGLRTTPAPKPTTPKPTTTKPTTTKPTTRPVPVLPKKTKEIEEGHLVGKAFLKSWQQELGKSFASGRTISVSAGANKRVIAKGDKCDQTKSSDQRVLFGNCQVPTLPKSRSKRASPSGYDFASLMPGGGYNLDELNPSGFNLNNVLTARHTEVAQRDVLFMLDESGSIGKARFEKIKSIAAAIVRLLCQSIEVSREKTRVALMSFDQLQHEEFNFNRYLYSYSATEEVARRIENVQYKTHSAGKTCLRKALDYSLSHIFTRSKGARMYESNVRQDIILISDGCENCDKDNDRALRKTIERINANDDFNVYVIGVNLRANCKEKLKIMAAGGSCYHFFFLDNWDYRVDAFIDELENPPSDFCLPKWQYPTSCDIHNH